jgi:hypothetical protein
MLSVSNMDKHPTSRNPPFTSVRMFQAILGLIKGIFPVPSLHPNTMHLGRPLIFSHRDKNKAYNFIHNKFIAKFGTIKSSKLTACSFRWWLMAGADLL